MATYFHGGTSEIQSSAADGFHTLYLLNPSSATTTYVPYSDTSPHPPAPTPNMLLLNPNSPPDALHHHAPPPSTHNLTLPTNLVPLGSHDPSRPSSFLPHDFSGFHGFAAAPPRVHYNLWPSTSIIDHPPPSASAATASTSSGRAASASVVGDASPHMSFRRPSQQGLSLSLSSQQTAYRSLSGELDVSGQPQVGAISGASCGRGGENVRVVVNHGSSNNVMSSVPSLILGSKYLKAAQEVLDEVVNVGKGIQKGESIEGANKEKMKANRDSTSGGNREGSSSGGGENSGKQAPELTTAQRQELQMKKSKLVSMLDEVEQRYRQYHHQMQMVISSFEQAAGYGASKTYTSLALKTISKQFRCLKDAIASQVKATSKSLGEDDCLGAKVEGSRLRYVDHHLRQQRALQQLGMMQHNAWRPQRGLPERAVSILRAWLFEHFLHPYPKDSDKVMLAKQTGLTRSQVSNWFINARVRLWKPMVEEMYMEEMKEQDGNNGSQENSRSRSKEAVGKEVGPTTNNKEESSQQLPHDQSGMKGFQSNINSYIPNQSFNNQRTSPMYLQPDSAASGAGLIHVHHHGMSPKKPRTSTSEIIMHNSPSSILSVETMEMKGGDTGHRERQCKEQGYPPLMMTNNANHDGGYGGFSMQDIGRFNNVADQLPPRFHGNAVSLTLGLPHTDSNIPLSHGFLSHNVNLASDHATTEFCGINTAPPSHSSTTSSNYDNNIDIQNRKRFAAQLLPDFVI